MNFSNFYFSDEAEEFDKAVIQVPEISTVCSGYSWGLAAHLAFHPSRELYFRRDGDNWIALAHGYTSESPFTLQPLELTWGFGTPLVGKDLQVQIDLLFALIEELKRTVNFVILTSMPNIHETISLFERYFERYFIAYSYADSISSMIADLSGGAGAFFDRRSSKFRSNLRRTMRIAQRESIEVEWHFSDLAVDKLFKRILQVEIQSWKFKKQESIFLNKKFYNFYFYLAHFLAKRDNLRILFLKKDGQDIAYVFGGVLGQSYRGFQLAYNDKFSSWGIGNLAQWEIIQRLAEEGITQYDLGMKMPYKERWSDKTLTLSNLFFYPRKN